jgi:hypothetical protein
MPECLEIVTSLRRLNSIASENSVTCSEHAELVLQLDFLEARDTWLDAALRESFFDVLEQYRARVFEIATQFHAIFRASAASTPLLNMWTTRRIQIFLSLLKQHSFADSASLRDAWEASVFFCHQHGPTRCRLFATFGKVVCRQNDCSCHDILDRRVTDLVGNADGLSQCGSGIPTRVVHYYHGSCFFFYRRGGRTTPASPAGIATLGTIGEFFSRWFK